MRHDAKYPQTHSAAVRQQPGNGGNRGGSNGGGSSGSDSSDYGYHGYGHHGGGHYRQATSGTGERIIYGRVGGAEHGGGGNGNGGGGGTVSALSGGGVEHEAQKQWEWLDEVLAKSSRNKETVSVCLGCLRSVMSRLSGPRVSLLHARAIAGYIDPSRG